MCSFYTCDILIFKRQTSTKRPKIVIYKLNQHCAILIFKRQTSTKRPKIVIYKLNQHCAHITLQKLVYSQDTSNMVLWRSPPSSEKSNSINKNTAIDICLYCHAQ